MRKRTPNPTAQQNKQGNLIAHYDSQGKVHFLNTTINTSNNIDHNYDINNRQEMGDPLLTCQKMSDPFPMCMFKFSSLTFIFKIMP